jgi:hypothetical protein
MTIMKHGLVRGAFSWFAVLPACFLVNSALPQQGRNTQPQIPDARIVDCLLQGEIVVLGGRIYPRPPRPARLPAIDCDIRGGEFMFSDPSSYDESLARWMGLAEEGDVKAQIYVGQIFERGLGREPDYARAAQWYRRAVESGNPVAQINLAQLYEKGLGVEQNLKEAERLYALAYGADDGAGVDIAIDRGSLGDPESRILELQAELGEARKEARDLAAQLDAARTSVSRVEDTLAEQMEREAQLQAELQSARSRVDAAFGDDSALQAARAALEASDRALSDQQRTITRLRDEIGRGERQIAAYESQMLRVSQLEAELQLKASMYERTNEELRQTRLALEASNRRLEEQQRLFERERHELDSARDSLNRETVASADDRRALEALLKEREVALAEREAALQAMRSEIDGYESQSRDLSSELNRLRRENEALIAARGDAERYREEVVRLQGTLRETESQLVQLRDRDDELLGALQHDYARLSDEADRYKARIAELEAAQADMRALAGPTVQLLEPAVFSERSGNDIVVRSATSQMSIIGKVIAPAGLLSLTINQEIASVNEENVFSSIVSLGGEQTPVSIVAIDNQGRRAAREINFVRELPTRNQVELPNVDFGQYYALLIANEEYAALPNLNTPKDDVEAIAALLREKYGFQTIVIKDGTRQQIMDSMYRLLPQLTSKDNLLIYYAGHGEYVTDTNRGVWLPVDASRESPANWISNIEINDYLQQMRAKQIIVIADSCYSGALTRSALINLRPGLTDEEYEAYLRKMSNTIARVALTSGGLAPVMDCGSGDCRHSIFANALIDVLNQNSSVLSAQDLGRTLAAKVSLAASRIGYEQEPQYAPLNHTQHEGGDFFFIPKFF